MHMRTQTHTHTRTTLTLMHTHAHLSHTLIHIETCSFYCKQTSPVSQQQEVRYCSSLQHNTHHITSHAVPHKHPLPSWPGTHGPQGSVLHSRMRSRWSASSHREGWGTRSSSACPPRVPANVRICTREKQDCTTEESAPHWQCTYIYPTATGSISLKGVTYSIC